MSSSRRFSTIAAAAGFVVLVLLFAFAECGTIQKVRFFDFCLKGLFYSGFLKKWINPAMRTYCATFQKFD